MTELKDICQKLAKSETEKEVIAILKMNGYWDDLSKWQVFGENENNFATIGNQQSRPEAALVEKLINSVDAVLMCESQKNNIPPDVHNSPKNMAEALEKFFLIPDGKLSNISAKRRTELSQRIRLVATGSKGNPCYTIIDSGEGQTPNRFQSTFLSTDKKNKLRIPFVQGKFNMGGTGVFQFCGKNNLQLIISKRHPEIVETGDNSQKQWGFTLIRRENPDHGVKSSVYKYLAPGGKILSFKADSLPLLPGPGAENYKEELKWGTFIKLYEYQMEGLKTNILFDLYNCLSLLMPSIALPIRLHERRNYEGHSLDTTLAGLSVRLEEDKNQNLEDKFPTSSSLNIDNQSMKASIYVFKKDKEINYKKSEGIIFTINGQTHGSIDRRFFSRSSVGMGYLANSILVIVDCTEFEGRAREDLFMNSRDRLRSCELKTNIMRTLEELIREHPGLRELREERKRQALQNKIKDDKPLADMLEKMLKKSPTLSKLFIEGVRLPNPFNTELSGASNSFTGKKFPTFFNISNEFGSQNPKQCPLNKKFKIRYRTDAVNDYFDRNNDPGIFFLDVEDESVAQYVLTPWNGNVNLTVALPKGVKSGDLIHYSWQVSDNKRNVFDGEFFVKVVDPDDEKSTGGQGSRRETGSEKGNDAERTSNLNIPTLVEVTRSEWPNYSFDEESALKVIDDGQKGYDFFINIDNKYLLTEKKSEKEEYLNLLNSRYKYGLTVIGLALLHHHEKNEMSKNAEEDEIFSQIEVATKAISPFLLPMISLLGELRPEEI